MFATILTPLCYVDAYVKGVDPTSGNVAQASIPMFEMFMFESAFQQ
jgi:hypothetical protein